MTTHSAHAIRPGSKFRAWGKSWKVLSNDTLNRKLRLKEVRGTETKLVRYQPSQVINCYWVPFNTQ